MKRVFFMSTLLGALILSAGCNKEKQNSQGEEFLNQVDKVNETIQDDSEMLAFFEAERNPVAPAFEFLPQGSTRPRGWILEIMKNDLEKGVVGALDDLYPGIKKDDLYRTARRGGLEDVPEMGDLVLTGEPWEKSIMWWNSETAGNWWDGFVRHAYLTGDEEAKNQAKKIVDNLIQSQDEDGYIGIYKTNLRYKHEGSNGELWSQTTAFRTMLGYYEITGDNAALAAVEKAMAVTMDNYGPQGQNPFDLQNAFGGVTHGLMMTDVCEWLYRITGKKQYQDYATYLYRAFSTFNVNRAFNDLRYPFLLERDSLFTGHGVHTYEHFRTLVNAYYDTGYPELETAFDNALYKLEKAILPSGAGHGNEWLAGLEADPTFTHTEYCTMLELRNSLASIFQKTGQVQFADHAEKLTFNGMMGFRNADGTAITYGKGDNCYKLDSHYHGAEENHEDVRYKYSPTHSDPAVCCVPNYSRNYPYFLDQMWLKAADGLVAAMYGPSELKTSVNGVELTITQKTNYPFSDKIEFEIKVEEPTTFALYFRKPDWCSEINVEASETQPELNSGFVKMERKWQSGDMFELTFVQLPKWKQLSNREVYAQRGPLVYALPISHREEVVKTYDFGDFRDYHCFPVNEEHQNIVVSTRQVPEVVSEDLPQGENPWLKMPLRLRTNDMELVPLGSTVLRRVTFPKK